MALIGYARVSTDDQTPALQLDALRQAGAAEVFEDVGVSGASRDRPGLRRALAALQAGDVLVVWRLDRLGRSLGDLISLVSGLKERGCGLLSITEAIDTSTPGGELVFHVFGAMAQFERSLGIERTRATSLWGVTSYVRRVLMRTAEIGADFSRVRLALIMLF
jgi:DNA invertase Pin-like site-specific DNA recombinase